MKYLEELWTKFQLWRKWRKIKAGKEVVDLKRHAGYFFPVGMISYHPKDQPHLIKMQSNKLMRAKLLDYELYSDPDDMVKWAKYQYLGYNDEKLFSEMTWEEYHAIHYY